MRSSKEFLETIFENSYWKEKEKIRPKLKPQLESHIPILGWIKYEEQSIQRESEPLCYQQVDFYLASKNKQIVRYSDLKEIESNVTSTLKIAGRHVFVTRSVLRSTNIDKNDQCGKSSWEIVYIPEWVFVEVSNSLGFSVIADINGHYDCNIGNARRVVFPREVMFISQPNEPVMLLNDIYVYFVRLHKNCAEYLTTNGVRLFDKRENKIDDTLLPAWRVTLHNHISSLHKEWHEKYGYDSATESAWNTLYLLASGEISNQENLFGKGLETLLSSECISANTLFSPCRLEKRVAFRDHHWKNHDYFHPYENVLNPDYLIIDDPSNA